MRYDFSPLYRSTVGFDRVFDMLDQATRVTDGRPNDGECLAGWRKQPQPAILGYSLKVGGALNGARGVRQEAGGLTVT